MRTTLLVALCLATSLVAIAPLASAADPFPYQCIRNGPPCGPEPVCVIGQDGDCIATMNCVMEPCPHLP